MSVPLSDTRLTEYRNLLAAQHLTPGPWKVEYESCDCSDYPCSHGSYVSAISAPVPTESSKERLERTGGKTEYYDFYRSEVGDFSAADWELMVAARNGLAELLAEVDRLRAELAKYVGHEPTIAEEMAELSRRLDAVVALLPDSPAEDINASWIPPRRIRAAVDGDTTALGAGQ